ncbi:hypothetical protein P175DRAFT_0235973 [Aspergillus ochraceoroseus IBT 24754]|uniref:Uncharacterized protein n=2 Tax=Aspergillus ochraceoroseus TaxID=138278 RepID=A0A2T5LX72_9EURO|nr:uncharacterized protein P175DRAFT_0235973 [Aspergillus ochraceoroseus IBT 24754]KKK12423.1 hypothetical protein AOCH_003153 [Aspergillus ochraceoroseus]PTU20881.1 hypothetical protein P175DRAFT_0235973 [Aspergillus ochraceoroseus IBT 24754]
MAAPLNNHVSVRRSIVMFLTIFSSKISSSYALNLPWERSSTCPSNYNRCSGSGLPDNFCCSSSSTCVTVDSGSSVICCPSGQSCAYIQTITCDVSQQNATLYPDAVIKTTRLDDKLPTCGDSCCPFGYTCQGSICGMDDTSSSTSTTTQSKTQTESTSSSTASISTATTTSSSSSSSTTTTTTDATASITPTVSSSTTTTDASTTLSTPYLQYSSISDSSNTSLTSATTCPNFPTNAILAGFFPGAVFGALASLLLTVCIRRQHKSNLPPSAKVALNTHRKSTGTLIGISDPIPSEDSSFRTDFLRRPNPKRQSEGARSVLQRSRSRVKSLFGAAPKPTPIPVEPVPPLPFTPPRQRQRQPSMESIRVYTPPGVFAPTSSSNAASPPDPRPNTTLGDLMNQAQASAANPSHIGNANNGGNPRFLLAPPPKLSSRIP